jgi:hypothetical protein
VTLGQPGATDDGTSVGFDGTTAQADITDASPLRLNGPFTIEFWARMSSFVNTWPGLLHKGAAGTNNGYAVWYESNGTVHFKRGNQDLATPAGELSSTTFRHFAVVDDGSTAKWYVNGTQVASQPYSVAVNAGADPLVLGQADQAGNESLDNVAVYNSALSAARLTAHVMAASGAPTVTAPGAPTNVTATAGNAQATVSWTAPASNGGAAISSYTVRASTGATSTVAGTTTSTTVTGLTNATAYTFTVTATNSAGTSPASTPSNSVTPTAPVAGNRYGNAVLADAPIAYWRLGEASGSTAADSSGHAATGSYVGGVTLGQPGALANDTNTAATFDGSTGNVTVPDSAALRLNGSFSIEFWAKMGTFVHTWPGLIYKGPSGTANGYLVWYTSTGVMHFKRNNIDVATPSGALTSGAWHYFAITYDGTQLKWYVNGSLVASRAVTFPTNAGTSALQLGRGDDFGNESLDEVAMYAGALSPSAVSTHYAAASG